MCENPRIGRVATYKGVLYILYADRMQRFRDFFFKSSNSVIARWKKLMTPVHKFPLYIVNLHTTIMHSILHYLIDQAMRMIQLTQIHVILFIFDFSSFNVDILTNRLLLPRPWPRETPWLHLISKKGYCGRINYVLLFIPCIPCT